MKTLLGACLAYHPLDCTLLFLGHTTVQETKINLCRSPLQELIILWRKNGHVSGFSSPRVITNPEACLADHHHPGTQDVSVPPQLRHPFKLHHRAVVNNFPKGAEHNWAEQSIIEEKKRKRSAPFGGQADISLDLPSSPRWRPVTGMCSLIELHTTNDERES